MCAVFGRVGITLRKWDVLGLSDKGGGAVYNFFMAETMSVDIAEVKHQESPPITAEAVLKKVRDRNSYREAVRLVREVGENVPVSRIIFGEQDRKAVEDRVVFDRLKKYREGLARYRLQLEERGMSPVDINVEVVDFVDRAAKLGVVAAARDWEREALVKVEEMRKQERENAEKELMEVKAAEAVEQEETEKRKKKSVIETVKGWFGGKEKPKQERTEKQDKSPKMSRRNFLIGAGMVGLGAVTVTTLEAAAAYFLETDTPAEAVKKIDLPEGKIDRWEKKENAEDNFKEVRSRIAKCEAMEVVIGDAAIAGDVKAEVLRRQGVGGQEWGIFQDKLSNAGVNSGDLLRVVAQTDANGELAQKLVGMMDRAGKNDVRPVLELVSAMTDVRAELRKLADVPGRLVEIYSSPGGRDTLKRLGYDVDSLEFKLTSEFGNTEKKAQVEKRSGETPIIWEENASGEDVLVMRNGDKHFVGRFYEEVKPHEKENAKHVVSRWQKMMETAGSVDQEEAIDYAKFAQWEYDTFRFGRKLNSGGTLSEEEQRIFDRGQNRLRRLEESLVKRGLEADEAKELVNEAKSGNLRSFRQLQRQLDVGGMAVFKTDVGTESAEENSITMFVRLALKKGGMTRENMESAAFDLQNNLHLVDSRLRGEAKEVYPANEENTEVLNRKVIENRLRDGGVHDREKAVLMEELARMDQEDREENRRRFLEVLTGKREIGDYIRWQRGAPEIVWSDGEKVTGRFARDYQVDSGDNKTLLQAVQAEGELWNSGTDFLTRLGYRNLSYLLKQAETASGASDPSMQMLEAMIGVGVGFQETYGPRPEGIRRSDLYGLVYIHDQATTLARGRVLEDLVPDTGRPAKDFLVAEGGDKEWGMVASKLETYQFSQMLRAAQTDEKVMKAYMNWVPMGAAEGMPMFGVEAAGRYFFGKDSNQLNRAEMAILAGLIQRPGKYAPRKYEEVPENEWKKPGVREFRAVDNSQVTKDRALTIIANRQNLGVWTAAEADEARRQLEQVEFKYQMPEGKKNNIPGGTPWDPANPTIDLGPIRVVMTGTHAEMRQVVPERVGAKELGLEIEMSPEQKRLAETMDKAIGKEAVGITAVEDSQLAADIASVWADITQIKGESLSYKQFGDRLREFVREKGWDGRSSEYGIKLVEKPEGAVLSRSWQCGEGMILVAGMLAEMNPNYRFTNMLSLPTERGVVDLVAPLEENKRRRFVRNDGIEYFDADLKKPLMEQFEVGDMVVSYRKGSSSDDSGHIVMIVDKGEMGDGKGGKKKIVRLIDINFDERGSMSSRTVAEENIRQNLYPGDLLHVVVMRQTGLEHGPVQELDKLKADDPRRNVQKVIPVEVESRMGVLPVFKGYSASGGDGRDFAGVAMQYFDSGAKLRAEENPSGVLAEVPVPMGNAMKPLLAAFMLYDDEVNGRRWDVEQYNFTAASGKQIFLDRKDPGTELVVNFSAYGNTSGGRENLHNSLAKMLDVPFQDAMKQLMNKDEKAWGNFCAFAEKFGINVVDLTGEQLREPTRYAATGRDVYATNLAELGHGMAVFFNAEKYFPDDAPLVRAVTKSREAVFDANLREKARKKSNNGDKENDLWDEGANGVCDTKSGEVVIGTDLGTASVELVVRNTGSGYEVGVGVARGQRYEKETRMMEVGAGITVPSKTKLIPKDIGMASVANAGKAIGPLASAPVVKMGMDVVFGK